MKRYTTYIALMLMLFASAACAPEENVVFDVDTDKITAGAEGGEYPIRLQSGQDWVAKTNEPWIAVSPANGRGSVDCMVMVDSTLKSTSRTGEVMIQTATESKTFVVEQDGFEYRISPKKELVQIKDFDLLENRRFKVTVETNVEFEVKLPSGSEWLTKKPYEVVLDRGARPRNVILEFAWDVNPNADERETEVELVAQVDGQKVSSVLKISQGGAPDIESVKDTPAGDSLALLSISRFLGCWSEFDTSVRMERWEGVTVHRSGPYKGRVKAAQFVFFDTKESLPYAVKYLTAADELYFFSNVNSSFKSLNLGKDICNLTNLKKLTLFSYGLTELPAEISQMTSLRYLDLGGNNFASIPKALKDCKSLKALFLTANQRSAVSDLSNTVKTDLGGLIDECPAEGGKRKFPSWILEWDQLDTLRLSVNYLQGELPGDEELLNENPYFKDRKWTTAELKDSLGTSTFFDENDVPKVLPDIDFFSMNLNRLHGNIPNWLKYHPKLDYWSPLLLVFPQEGKDKEGNLAGFTDEPTNLNYYYDVYMTKKYSEAYEEE